MKLNQSTVNMLKLKKGAGYVVALQDVVERAGQPPYITKGKVYLYDAYFGFKVINNIGLNHYFKKPHQYFRKATFWERMKEIWKIKR